MQAQCHYAFQQCIGKYQKCLYFTATVQIFVHKALFEMCLRYAQALNRYCTWFVDDSEQNNMNELNKTTAGDEW